MLDETVLGSGRRRSMIAKALAQARIAVARVDGQVRGFVISEDSFFGHGFVALLIVHPDFRRRGLATALMRAAELDCQTEKIFTSTNQSNIPMQQLCARIGYVKSGYIENLDEGDPELIYMKRLTPQATTGAGAPPRDSDDD
ncbi:MAG TPA: GNAT family N-acetyltransferase [Candidatus Acidoferrales bacterium]|nr:GNAT family N-acetyltransferase [Candidatus Acidoferrales bacterium]